MIKEDIKYFIKYCLLFNTTDQVYRVIGISVYTFLAFVIASIFIIHNLF